MRESVISSIKSKTQLICDMQSMWDFIQKQLIIAHKAQQNAYKGFYKETI